MTIKTAVAASQAGDIVEVDDGLYFEKNIIIDKNIRIKSKRLFGAVVYGSVGFMDAIFVVRAEADISGFVLQNSQWGLLQRYSPDVSWTAHDLVIMNMTGAGVSINDTSGNIGSAMLENLYISHCKVGIGTNDARDLRISGALISSCNVGVTGSDHLSFQLENSAIMNCGSNIREGTSTLSGKATNKISIGQDVLFPDREVSSNYHNDLRARLSVLWKRGGRSGDEERSALAKRDLLLDQAIGDFYFRGGAYAQAAKVWSKALDRVKSIKFLDMTWRIEQSLARTAERLGDTAMALAHLKNAVEEIVNLSQRFPFKYFQESFFEDKGEVFDECLGLLYEMHCRQPNRDYMEEAYRYSEIAKSLGSWSDLFNSREGRQAGSSGAAPDIRGTAALKGIARTQRLLTGRTLAVEERRRALERLENFEDEYKAYFVQQIGLRAGQRSSATLPSLRPEEIRKRILNRETALIEYYLGPEQAYAFLLTGNDLKMVRLSSVNRLYSFIPNYLDFLRLGGEKEFSGARGGRILYDTLLAPLNLGEAPEIKKLIIVPDGILHFLPFEALVLPPKSTVGPVTLGPPKATAVGPFLLDRYEVIYAPSAAVFAFLANESRREMPAMDLLAMANPGPNSPSAYPELGTADLPGLHFVAKELEAIAGSFRGPKTRIVPLESSSEEHFKSLDLSRYRIVHLAAHGIFDEKHWWRSAIVLDRGKGPEEDGLLQPLDITTIPLNADLVVLSSCVSGNVRIQSGKGIVGLYQSFFLSGAKAVLATFWAIDDRSTVRLMDVFYSELRKGKSASEALRAAKLDLIRSGYSHPRYWAAFVLSGAGLDPIFPQP